MKFLIEVADRYGMEAVSLAEYCERGGDIALAEFAGDWIPILDMKVVTESGE